MAAAHNISLITEDIAYVYNTIDRS